MLSKTLTIYKNNLQPYCVDMRDNRCLLCKKIMTKNMVGHELKICD
jgi:hypothetical protein